MKKIIAAIIAVICVHIGFSMMVATEPAAEQAAATVRKLPQTDHIRIAPLPEIGDDIDLTPEFQASAAERKRILTPAIDRVVTITRRSTFPGAGRLMAKTPVHPRSAAVPIFAPVVITPHPIPISADIGEQRTARVENAAFNEKPQKRSLMANAMPIVKKPWNWLKFVGSRLR